MIIQGKVWGHTTPLFNMNNVELHIAEIKKGGYCSKHKHAHKYNRFVVLKGKLKVTIWKEYASETLQDVSILGISQECTVSPGDYHKFEALEDCTVLEIYWVCLSESDIIRNDHGGIYHAPQTVISATECHDRKAIFVDERQANQWQDNYGTKYFGNENDKVSLR